MRQSTKLSGIGSLTVALGLTAAGVFATPTPEGVDFFELKIRPVLVQHCYQCHSSAALHAGKLKAELLVDSRAGMEKGGETGPAVVPGKRDKSLLLAALKHDGFEMPPAGKLPAAVIVDFETWIDMGAPDPRDAAPVEVSQRTIDTAAGREHWSYRRLPALSPPVIPAGKRVAWLRNDIDRFVLEKQAAAGIEPSPIASKEMLARRVFFDTIGLPPSPSEMQLFLADSSSDAYEQLVDRLLASPRYGERWARHWLDAVRFAESGGYEFDNDRPGAYHYRDFVIRALNADMPYDEFLRLQVAGDLLKPGDYDAVSATGFFVAGPYPGQRTAKTDEPIRYDQLDDMVSALGSGMLGMTIGCARCHDHKYDAITHRDYYAMIAVLQNTVHTTVKVDPDSAATQRKHAEWEAKRAAAVATVDRLRTQELGPKLNAWLQGDAAKQTAEKWMTLDPQKLSASKATLEEADDVVLAAGTHESDDAYTFAFHTHQKGLTCLRLEALANPNAPGGGPGVGPDGAFRLTTVKLTAAPLVAAADRQPIAVQLRAAAATYEEPGFELAKAVDGDDGSGWSIGGQIGRDHAAVFEFDQDIGFEGGSLLTVELHFQQGQHGLSRMRLAVASALRPAVLDGGAAPQGPREVAALLAGLRAAGKEIASDEQVAGELLQWFRRFDPHTEQAIVAMEATRLHEPQPTHVEIYATGAGGGDVFVLARGEVNRKQEKAQAGFVRAAVASDTAEIESMAGADGKPLPQPRLALATILTSVESGAGPLAARVAVNRLWHHHFGRGIVATPNDLGTQGEKPTHPELLDWLAGRLVENKWSLKSIHRLIVTSATYMQASTVNEASRAQDPDNRWLWHRQPIRLEGEVIRDAMLASAGTLDAAMFGPGSLDGSSRRRSVYLTVKRSQPVPFLQVFDQPEPIQSVGARGTATVPTQALIMMNDPFVRAAAEGLAKRALEAAGVSPEATIGYAFSVALSRQPQPEEQAQFLNLFQARQQAAGGDQAKSAAALADICQLLFCLNEFVYVD